MLVTRLALPPPIPGVRGSIPGTAKFYSGAAQRTAIKVVSRIQNLKACLVQKEIPRLRPAGWGWCGVAAYGLIAAVKQVQADLEVKVLKTKESVV